MARPLRIEYPGALYHVTSRGNAREAIYLDEGDRQLFLGVLADVVGDFNWAIHAYCLMDNHYHLLVETPDGNLCKGMRQLNGIYTQRFNRRRGRVGHVFQGRYKGILVQKEAYLLELARYIVLNPVRAGMAQSPEEWEWSSYRATAGLCEPPDWLATDWLLAVFSDRYDEACRRYEAFVRPGNQQPSPWGQLKNQIFLGTDEFISEAQRHVKPDRPLREVPTIQRRPRPKSLAQLAERYERDDAICQAYASGGYTLQEIGDYFGLHYSSISRIKTQRRYAKRKT